MLPCHHCGYRGEIEWNGQSSCDFDWGQATEEERAAAPALQVRHGERWFHFPSLYDPAWGQDTCPAYSQNRDPQKIREISLIENIMSILRDD